MNHRRQIVAREGNLEKSTTRQCQACDFAILIYAADSQTGNRASASLAENRKNRKPGTRFPQIPLGG
jgi:hypothetical protein